VTSPTPILHIDMDAFFAAVTIRERPELRRLPVLVGGGGTRGVVLSATYPARAAGVHSGMPMARALRMCPDAVVVSPGGSGYSAVSHAVMETFRSITPLVQAMSVDEAFLDVSGAERRFGSPERIGELLRARIADEQGITCSVGVAATVELAKLASGLAKPDGMMVLRPEDVPRVVHPLPVDALWGVGPKIAAQLRRIGLETVGDVSRTPVSTLRHALGPAAGTAIHLWSRGVGRREIRARTSIEVPDRSIGAQETFGRDLGDPVLIRRELLRLATRVAVRVRAAGVVGRTVTLTVRFTDFTTITRAHSLGTPTDVTADVYAAVSDLYAALALGLTPLRLVGVRVSGLVPGDRVPRQLVLGQREPGRSDVERAADRLVERFGSRAVRPGSLVGRERP
jgi:DNA polymerase IV